MTNHLFKRDFFMAMLFIGLTIVFTVTGQLLIKWGMLQVGPRVADVSHIHYLFSVLFNVGFLFGMICAFAAAIFWALALTIVPISFAYPFTSLGLVLVMVLSGIIFGETVSLIRWLGVIVVIAGIIIAARG